MFDFLISSLPLLAENPIGSALNPTVLTLLYLVSSVLFIFGVKRLAGVRTAAMGNRIAAAGMFLAVVTTLASHGGLASWAFLAIFFGLGLGSFAGYLLAKRVEMTAMPELVGFFNGLGGVASALVALSFVFQWPATQVQPQVDAMTKFGLDADAREEALADHWDDFEGLADATSTMTVISIVLSVLIGALTLTGSMVAFGKLSGKISGNPILIPSRHAINAGIVVAAILLCFWFGASDSFVGINTAILLITVLACVLGVTLVIPIGGADMPVVISLLNSYSGVAAAMTGFVLHNNLLIIAGSLVGASGIILTQIMCKAMNRSLANVLFGGFGGDGGSSGDGPKNAGYTKVKSCGAEECAMVLEAAQSVIFVPGYGLAVAQAQHTVKELADLLEKKGAHVKYAIHPVAGRMPGHMNVLLAEANVPYEQLVEMDDINPAFKNTDVAIVVGANDVVNPVARNQKDSPIYGMPILDVDQVRSCFVIKRSLSPGFAGIDNPLFEADNNMMIYGDAKKVLEDIVKELKNA